MADVDLMTEALLNLRMNCLPDDWVEAVWDNDFLDIPSLPVEAESLLEDRVQLGNSLCELHGALKPWVKGEDATSGQAFWSILLDNNLTVKSIVAFLFQLMAAGQKKGSRVDAKITGSVASAVYFLLLRVNGSRAYKVFSNSVFQNAVSMLTALCPSSGASKNKKKRQKGNPVRRPKRQRGRHQVVEPTSSEEDEEQEDEESLGPQMLRQLSASRIGLLRDFVALIKNYQLDDVGAMHALQSLVLLTTVEPDDFVGAFRTNREIDDMNSVPELAFAGLRFMCSADRSGKLEVITNILRCLMPNVLMLTGLNSSVVPQTISRPSVLIRDLTVTFVCELMHQNIDGVLSIIRIFLQNLCARVPDKVDYRTKVSQAILTIMKDFPTPEYASFVKWIVRYSKNAKVLFRVFALDLISGLLDEQNEFRDVSVLSADLQSLLSHKKLLEVVVKRCSDISPSVRSSAIDVFARCSSSNDPAVAVAISMLVTPRNVGRPATPCAVGTPRARVSVHDGPGSEADLDTSPDIVKRSDIVAMKAEGMDIEHAEGEMNQGDVTPVDGADILLGDSNGVISMLRRRCNDNKIGVRKSALVAVEMMVRMEGCDFSGSNQNLKVIEDHCRDSALSVRKQAMQSLTALLNTFPNSETVQRSWLSGLLPVVTDGEPTVQSKCLQLLEETMLQNVLPYQEEGNGRQFLTWKLLKIIAVPENVGFRRYFQKACHHWGKGGSVPSNIIRSIRSHVGTENNEAAWFLLSELASYLPKFNTDFLLEYWNIHAKQEKPTASSQGVLIRVITVLRRVAKNMTVDTAVGLLDDLKNMVSQFNLPPDLTSSVIMTINKIAEIGEALKANVSDWFGDILRKCDQYLSSIILCENPESVVLDEESLVQHLFVLGEIAQLYPDKTPKRVSMLVQSIIAAPALNSNDGFASSQSSQAHSQILSQFRGSNLSPRVRAVAFISLGKLCLQNEDVARACVPALAREIETSPDAPVRNNVVIVLCDLCIRYTSLVDRYIGCISSCLKDESVVIRRQTLILLTHLLQEDYIKWKGSLFYRFVIATVDDVPCVRDFANFTLVHIFLHRHPGLYFNHFIKSIFYFNSYTDHPTYNKLNETEREVKLFSLKGTANTEKRMKIYKFLLGHMNDGHRFQIMGKLVQEVLLSFVDEVLPLNDESGFILHDALNCLASKEIKLSMLRSKPADEVVENEEEAAAALVNVAKKTIVSQVMKKTVMESTIPVMISLKHMLEQHNSPLLKDFMVCLRELMKDYKNEVKDVLAADKQLADEIEFDLQKFEENEANFVRQNRKPLAVPKPGKPLSPALVANLQGTPTVRTPRASLPSVSGSRSSLPTVVNNDVRMSLATVAILNSARKAMAQTERMAERRQIVESLENSTESVTEVNAKSSERVQMDVGPVMTEIGCHVTPKSTKRAAPLGAENALRAISTPTASSHLNDFTFSQTEENLSIIVPLRPATRSSSGQQKTRDEIEPSSDLSEEFEEQSSHVPNLSRNSMPVRSQRDVPVVSLARLSIAASSDKRTSVKEPSNLVNKIGRENSKNSPRKTRKRMLSATEPLKEAVVKESRRQKTKDK